MLEALRLTAPAGTACLVGIPSAGSKTETDLGDLYRQLMLTNQIVIATIMANRRHFDEATELLAEADHDWLSAIITHCVGLADWQEAFQPPYRRRSVRRRCAQRAEWQELVRCYRDLDRELDRLWHGR